MLGEVAVFAAFLLLFAILILVQQTGVGATSVVPRGAADDLAAAAPYVAGGAAEEVQPNRP